MRVLSSEIKNHGGKNVKVRGWLHKKRKLGGLNFINVRDRRGLVQILVEAESEMEKLRGLQIGTVLTVEGKVKKDERAPNGAEIHDPKLTVEVPVEDEPPIEIDKPLDHKSENLDTLFEHRVIGLRNLREQAIFRIQAEVKEAARQYLRGNEFVEFNSPKLLAGATEGGAEVFKLDYFGQSATLAQSGQFYKQIMAGVYERVFEINPTYRAEPSATTRHMSEFIHIDVEMCFVDFNELLNTAEGLLRAMVEHVCKTSEEQLRTWNAQKPKLAEKLPRMTLTEVHELYEKETKDKIEDKRDLTPAEERWVCEYAKKKHGSEAVFVTDWPEYDMKFYHKTKDDNPKTAERADLLFRGVEIATITMREHRYGQLVKQLKEKTGAAPDEPGFKYYLQAFKYGMPPHGGFGWGLERTVEKILNLNNVKEATLFPRDMNRLAP